MTWGLDGKLNCAIQRQNTEIVNDTSFNKKEGASHACGVCGWVEFLLNHFHTLWRAHERGDDWAIWWRAQLDITKKIRRPKVIKEFLCEVFVALLERLC